MSTVNEDTATALDDADELASWRDEFVIVDPAVIYLDGNSLGMTPRRTVEALDRVVGSEWAGDLITSWWKHDWLDLPLVVGDELAPVVGAEPGEIVVHESTTVCLFQLVSAALDATVGRRGGVLAVSPSEFPTDRYVVGAVARGRTAEVIDDVDDVSRADVVVRSLVDYRTAALGDLAGDTARARAAAATIVWDLSHAAGVVEVDLTGAGVDYAAGCTYKFLNGGPGAPAFAYVRRDRQEELVQPIDGWFGQVEQFDMDAEFAPRPGVARLLNGTPGVLGLTAARAGISLTREAGIAAIAAKARRLASFTIDAAAGLGLDCVTARPPASSGGHVSIRHPRAAEAQQRLADRGVIVDKRDPDILRLGLSPLTTRFGDVWRGIRAIAEHT